MRSNSVVSNTPPSAAEPKRNLIQKSATLLSSLKWLTPLPTLDSCSSTDFGRNIEHKLKSLTAQHGVLSVMLRRRKTAVVLSVEHYENLIKMKNSYEELVQTQKRQLLADIGGEFEQLYSQMQTPASRQAVDALFAADAQTLRDNFRPGRTEAAE